uniref:Putative ovule protein n=1 Tax=Solanum chacoense TaxID=4108 RepID=A0A0V0GQI7_SOLCH
MFKIESLYNSHSKYVYISNKLITCYAFIVGEMDILRKIVKHEKGLRRIFQIMLNKRGVLEGHLVLVPK